MRLGGQEREVDKSGLDRSEFSDASSIMSLPGIHTEDQIFNPFNNPPSSSDEVGADAEDFLECYQFMGDWDELALPGDTNLEIITPSLIAMHQEAIGTLLSIPKGPMPEVVEIPDDPAYVSHSIASWPNEGIRQTEQDLHRGSVSRRSRHFAKPVAKPNDMTCMHAEPEMQVVLPQAPVEDPLPIGQQFSPPSPAMAVPLSATDMDIAFVTQPQPQPPTNEPAEISTTTSTTARIVDMINTGTAPTCGVDVSTPVSTGIEISHSPQVQITTPRPAPTIHDLSSPIVTAPGDREVSLAPQPKQGYFSGAHEEQSSNTWCNTGSPIEWPNAIADSPYVEPHLEFFGPFEETLSPTGKMMDLLLTASPISVTSTATTAKESPTKDSQVSEQLSELVPEQISQLPCFVEPMEHQQTKQQQEGTISKGSAPVSAPASESNVPVRRHARGHQRAKWTQQLHKRFMDAIKVIDRHPTRKVTPKNVHHVMNCPDLTPQQVKSHLQKYRSYKGSFDSECPSCEGSSIKKRRLNRSGSSVSSSDQAAGEVAEQEQMQQQLLELLEALKITKEMQAMMEKKGEQLERHGEHLQRMITAQQAMMDRLMAEAPAEASDGPST